MPSHQDPLFRVGFSAVSSATTSCSRLSWFTSHSSRSPFLVFLVPLRSASKAPAWQASSSDRPGYDESGGADIPRLSQPLIAYPPPSPATSRLQSYVCPDFLPYRYPLLGYCNFSKRVVTFLAEGSCPTSSEAQRRLLPLSLAGNLVGSTLTVVNNPTRLSN